MNKNGRMLALGSFGRKVSPAVGNIQAAGETYGRHVKLVRAAAFIVTQHEAHLDIRTLK